MFPAIGIPQNVYPLEFATQGHKPQTLGSFTLPSVFAVPIWLAKLLNFSPNLLRLLLFIHAGHMSSQANVLQKLQTNAYIYVGITFDLQLLPRYQEVGQEL